MQGFYVIIDDVKSKIRRVTVIKKVVVTAAIALAVYVLAEFFIQAPLARAVNKLKGI